MNKLFLLPSLVVLFISSVSATTIVSEASPEINQVGVCSDAAVNKIKVFSESNGIDLSTASSMRLVFNDRRALNPFHYSSYEVDAEKDGKIITITTFVQRNRITKECF